MFPNLALNIHKNKLIKIYSNKSSFEIFMLLNQNRSTLFGEMELISICCDVLFYVPEF
jgi:hypothetical protein